MIFIQKIYSYLFERYLGIETTGVVAPTVQGGVHYAALPYHVIHRILNRLAMREDDVFVDVGSGKGRVIACACRLKIRKIVAIEVNEELLQLSVRNVNKIRQKLTKIEPLALPAEEYHYDDSTVIYLYNPFDQAIMEKVFARIDESYRRQPRNLQVAYANCLHEGPLRDTGWLEKREEWPSSMFPGFGCPISFWSSR